MHQKSKKYSKKREWGSYEWVRFSEFFSNNPKYNDKPFYVFDTIEPEDVKQGNCDNCHLLAALSGLAERDLGAKSKTGEQSKSVQSLLVTKKINKAGCYAV